MYFLLGLALSVPRKSVCVMRWDRYPPGSEHGVALAYVCLTFANDMTYDCGCEFEGGTFHSRGFSLGTDTSVWACIFATIFGSAAQLPACCYSRCLGRFAALPSEVTRDQYVLLSKVYVEVSSMYCPGRRLQ